MPKPVFWEPEPGRPLSFEFSRVQDATWTVCHKLQQLCDDVENRLAFIDQIREAASLSVDKAGWRTQFCKKMEEYNLKLSAALDTDLFISLFHKQGDHLELFSVLQKFEKVLLVPHVKQELHERLPDGAVNEFLRAGSIKVNSEEIALEVVDLSNADRALVEAKLMALKQGRFAELLSTLNSKLLRLCEVAVVATRNQYQIPNSGVVFLVSDYEAVNTIHFALTAIVECFTAEVKLPGIVACIEAGVRIDSSYEKECEAKNKEQVEHGSYTLSPGEYQEKKRQRSENQSQGFEQGSSSGSGYHTRNFTAPSISMALHGNPLFTKQGQALKTPLKAQLATLEKLLLKPKPQVPSEVPNRRSHPNVTRPSISSAHRMEMAPLDITKQSLETPSKTPVFRGVSNHPGFHQGSTSEYENLGSFANFSMSGKIDLLDMKAQLATLEKLLSKPKLIPTEVSNKRSHHRGQGSGTGNATRPSISTAHRMEMALVDIPKQSPESSRESAVLAGQNNHQGFYQGSSSVYENLGSFANFSLNIAPLDLVDVKAQPEPEPDMHEMIRKQSSETLSIQSYNRLAPVEKLQSKPERVPKGSGKENRFPALSEAERGRSLRGQQKCKDEHNLNAGSHDKQMRARGFVLKQTTCWKP